MVQLLRAARADVAGDWLAIGPRGVLVIGVQYDELRIEHDQGEVEIVVYNRTILFTTENEAVREPEGPSEQHSLASGRLFPVRRVQVGHEVREISHLLDVVQVPGVERLGK